MKIKIISLWQPWAWAMWNLLKKWETRDSRAPVVAQLRTYRGPLGIQAAKKIFNPNEYTAEFAHKCRALDIWPDRLEYGVLGGICNFKGDIVRTQHAFSRVGEQELFWGNYDPERRAIHCPDMVKLPTPIPMRGHQGLWDYELPPEIEQLLEEKWGRLPA